MVLKWTVPGAAALRGADMDSSRSASGRRLPPALASPREGFGRYLGGGRRRLWARPRWHPGTSRLWTVAQHSSALIWKMKVRNSSCREGRAKTRRRKPARDAPGHLGPGAAWLAGQKLLSLHPGAQPRKGPCRRSSTPERVSSTAATSVHTTPATVLQGRAQSAAFLALGPPVWAREKSGSWRANCGEPPTSNQAAYQR